MKTRIHVGLCIVVAATILSARADDTPEQAAARASFELKIYELDHPQAQPSTDTNSTAAIVQPAASTNNVTAASDWLVALGYLDGAPCWVNGFTVGFAIAEGHYTPSNVTEAKFLDLVNPGVTYFS